MKHGMASIVLALALAGTALSQQAQKLSGSSWVNCTTDDNLNNNDNIGGNGPVLGTGTGSDGAYYTWSYNGTQYRVLKSVLSAEQQTQWQALVSHSIEFIMAQGSITDIHDNV